MKEFNIALLGVSSQNMNKGCEALLYSELFILKKLENNNRHFNIFLLEGSAKGKVVYYNIMGEMIKVTILPVISSGSPYSWLINVKNRKELKKYAAFDYVLAIGFGDSFADIYGEERFKSVNNPIEQCFSKKKKVILMPQTIGPFQDDRLKANAVKTINRSILVFPRDRQSYNFVLENSKNQNVKEMIDVAFFLPYEKHSFKNNKINVGIALSGLLWRNGYTGNNEFGLSIDYKKLMLDLIEWFISHENIQVILTPHVVCGDALCDDDYALSYRIQQKYGEDKILLSPFFKDPIIAKSYISGLDFFVGSRMHACIAAFSSGVPVVPISYSRKFTGLFVDTLDYPYVANPISSSYSQIISMIQTNFKNRDKLKKITDTTMYGIVCERGKKLNDELDKLFL